MLENDIELIKKAVQGYVAHWIYEENGCPIMLVARYESHQKKTFRQFHWSDNELKEGMPQASPYPLFGLSTLKRSSPFGGPMICEGEKCAGALHQLELPAITSVLGASNVSNSDFTPLRHFKQFLILRDNDKAGIDYCRRVAVELRRVCPEAIILVCNLTPDIAGGDVVDWIQQKPLYGHGWNGFQPLPPTHKEHVKQCLSDYITQYAKPIEECSEVGFNPSLCIFDGDPRPFHQQLEPVPPFPIDSMPPDISTYITIISKQFSLPCDFAGTVFLTLLGGVIGRALTLEMRPGQEWRETANVWGILIGNPSAKKSPIYRRISKLIAQLEKKAQSDHQLALKVYSQKKKDAKANDEEFDEPAPLMRRYTTDDCTTPKLRELMTTNPRGIILHNDELKGQLEKLDKQGSEGDRAFMMQCWSGLEVYNEDRMTRVGGYRIPITLTWIGCIPPTALASYLREAQSHGSGADGFMQRFQMVTYPDFRQPYTLCADSVPASLQSKVEAIFQEIDLDALQDPDRVVQFDPQAQEVFNDWHVTLENDCRSGKQPIFWESHLGKQTKLLAAICLILHRLNEVQSGETKETIPLETLQGALKLQHYYQEHARRCYSSTESLEVIDAKTILNLTCNKRLPERFKAQDIYRQGLGGLKDSPRVRNALELLRESNWVALEKIRGATGAPSEFWIINPKAKDKST